MNVALVKCLTNDCGSLAPGRGSNGIFLQRAAMIETAAEVAYRCVLRAKLKMQLPNSTAAERTVSNVAVRGGAPPDPAALREIDVQGARTLPPLF